MVFIRDWPNMAFNLKIPLGQIKTLFRGKTKYAEAVTMSKKLLTFAIVIITITALLGGCSGGGNDNMPPDWPAESYTINASTPSSGGPVTINPSADGKFHVQPWQEFKLDVTASTGKTETKDSLDFAIAVEDANGNSVSAFGTGYRSAVPGEYVATAVINPDSSNPFVVTAVIVVDPLAVSQVHLWLTERVIGDQTGSYWDTTGFNTVPGTQWVFTTRWYNDLVPGYWAPEVGSFEVRVPNNTCMVDNTGTYYALLAGTVTVSASATLEVTGKQYGYDDVGQINIRSAES